MGAMASQIISLTFVFSTVYSGADQRKHQSYASLAFVRGIHRWPMNSPHKWPVTREMFPFDDVIMNILHMEKNIIKVLMSQTRTLCYYHFYYENTIQKGSLVLFECLQRQWKFIRYQIEWIQNICHLFSKHMFRLIWGHTKVNTWQHEPYHWKASALQTMLFSSTAASQLGAMLKNACFSN